MLSSRDYSNAFLHLPFKTRFLIPSCTDVSRLVQFFRSGLRTRGYDDVREKKTKILQTLFLRIFTALVANIIFLSLSLSVSFEDIYAMEFY